jgi:hypothetical protein
MISARIKLKGMGFFLWISYLEWLEVQLAATEFRTTSSTVDANLHIAENPSKTLIAIVASSK